MLTFLCQNKGVKISRMQIYIFIQPNRYIYILFINDTTHLF